MGCNELVTCPGRVDVTHKIINGDRLQCLQVTLSGGQSRKMDGRTEVGTKMMSNEYTGVLCCIQPVFWVGMSGIILKSRRLTCCNFTEVNTGCNVS